VGVPVQQEDRWPGALHPQLAGAHPRVDDESLADRISAGARMGECTDHHPTVLAGPDRVGTNRTDVRLMGASATRWTVDGRRGPPTVAAGRSVVPPGRVADGAREAGRI